MKIVTAGNFLFLLGFLCLWHFCGILSPPMLLCAVISIFNLYAVRVRLSESWLHGINALILLVWLYLVLSYGPSAYHILLRYQTDLHTAVEKHTHDYWEVSLQSTEDDEILWKFLNLQVPRAEVAENCEKLIRYLYAGQEQLARDLRTSVMYREKPAMEQLALVGRTVEFLMGDCKGDLPT
ncbi:hypothetical protein PG988_004935 [Apiospora saccharicola]